MDRIGIYLRISDDPHGTQTATKRQHEDCQRFAESRGWDVVDVFEDVDLSAYKATVKRPEFERMIEAITDKRIDGVLAWKIDRLSRRMREFVRLDEACERSGAFVATVTETIDTRQPTGRFVAELLTAQARMESANTATRVARSHEAMAKAGRTLCGGHRAFGYSKDRLSIVPEEAEVVKEVARRALEGETIRGIARDLNRRGIRTSTGGEWQPAPLKRMITSALLSGQREHKGVIVADGNWPGILDPETTRRVRAVLRNPARRKSMTNARSYLLSGFLTCGHCGGRLVARPRMDKVRRYVCPLQPYGSNCGKLSVLAEPLEELVRDMLAIRLNVPGILDPLPEDDDLADVHEALAKDEAALVELTTDYYTDRILTKPEFAAARAALDARIEANRRKLTRTSRPTALATGRDFLSTWEAASFDEKRSIIAAVIETVKIGPAVKGRNTFDADRVTPVWRV